MLESFYIFCEDVQVMKWKGHISLLLYRELADLAQPVGIIINYKKTFKIITQQYLQLDGIRTLLLGTYTV